MAIESKHGNSSVQTPTDRVLVIVWGVIAAAALVGTWWNNLLFFKEAGTWSGLAFIEACFANHAAASISIDILLFGLAAMVFMKVEAKRLGIRFLWVYIVLSFLIAVSVMFPLFMIARQLRIAATNDGRLEV
jgi:uncharacterized protein DUF2834